MQLILIKVSVMIRLSLRRISPVSKIDMILHLEWMPPQADTLFEEKHPS